MKRIYQGHEGKGELSQALNFYPDIFSSGLVSTANGALNLSSPVRGSPCNGARVEGDENDYGKN